MTVEYEVYYFDLQNRLIPFIALDGLSTIVETGPTCKHINKEI